MRYWSLRFEGSTEVIVIVLNYLSSEHCKAFQKTLMLGLQDAEKSIAN